MGDLNPLACLRAIPLLAPVGCLVVASVCVYLFPESEFFGDPSHARLIYVSPEHGDSWGQLGTENVSEHLLTRSSNLFLFPPLRLTMSDLFSLFRLSPGLHFGQISFVSTVQEAGSRDSKSDYYPGDAGQGTSLPEGQEGSVPLKVGYTALS